jgi:hypothetical protein
MDRFAWSRWEWRSALREADLFRELKEKSQANYFLADYLKVLRRVNPTNAMELTLCICLEAWSVTAPRFARIPKRPITWL